MFVAYFMVEHHIIVNKNNNYLTQNPNNIKIHINMRKFSYSTEKTIF